MVLATLGFFGKLPKVPTSTFPNFPVSGLHSGLSHKTAESPTREGLSHKVAGYIPLGEGESESKQTRTDTRENVNSNIGYTTCPSLLQRATDIKTQGIENERVQYPRGHETILPGGRTV